MFRHYRIMRKLGEGGMGVVYAAHDERLGRAVAIKSIHAAATDPRARERLWREARAAASVNHPNICQIYEIVEEEGDPYIVMELLEGESLADRLARGPLALADAAPIAREMLAGLEAIHAGGLIHRDLKPSNVFLATHGVKLLDFGLARTTRPDDDASTRAAPGGAESRLTMPGTVVGTPRYMAPEQLEGRAVDHRADLFAAGAVLFEMLAGHPPFGGDSPMQVFHAILYDQPPALGGSGAIEAVSRVILRALAKRAEERPATAGAMARELRDALGATAASDASAAPAAAVSARPMNRLIVLPLRILRSDPETDYLAFSLPDAITSSLVGVASLVVRSSLVASRFADDAPDLRAIASEAEVDLVLAGSLLRVGDQVRVVTQLVEAPAGSLVWSHTSQVPLREIFSLEETLTQRVVESLALPLSERERRVFRRDVPASPTAYEYYLRGSQQGHGPQHWAVARDLFLRAVEEDPRYAPAWARLARCYWLIGKYSGDHAGNASQAEAALQRALELNPDLPIAHQLYAHIEAHDGRSIDAMRRLLDRVRTQKNDPELFAGLVLACRYAGLLDASIAAHERARSLDPKIRTSVTHTYFMLREYDAALREAGFDIGYIDALVLAMKGQEAEALARLRRRERDRVDDSNAARWMRSLHALLEGDRDECVASLGALSQEFGDPEGFYYVGRAMAKVGDVDRAIAVLRRAVEKGFFCLAVLVDDPWLASLRGRDEFAEAIARAERGHADAVAAFAAAAGDRLLGVATSR
jgi:non-specific serine/threonine protein kinase